MGQKASPIALRLGIIRDWDSSWYADKDFADKLLEDYMIRKYLRARFPRGHISRIMIERMLNRIIVVLHTASAGIVIGKGGSEVNKVREELKKITKKDVSINVVEIKRPEVDALLLGQSVAAQVEGRISHRRAMKQAIASAMRVGALGVKIRLSGRLGGAEMARTEKYREGRIPLHTLSGDVDYATCEARTVYGKIGVKVWIYKGKVYKREQSAPTKKEL